MDTNVPTYEQLAERVRYLELQNEQLLRERAQSDRLEFAWAGNLGHWYWDIATNKVAFNPLKVTALGYADDEVPTEVPFQYFTDKLHPDDYEPVMEAMRAHMRGEVGVYEVEYRIKAKDGSWKWFYDRGRITRRSPEGAPLYASGIVFDVTDAKREYEHLQRVKDTLQAIAITDTLTGLANRRGAEERIELMERSAKADTATVAVAMVDLDGFKSVNDRFGHAAGDDVLKATGRILLKGVRDEDLVARWGGEEFLLVLPGLNPEEAGQALERLRASLEAHVHAVGEPVTASFGYACGTYGKISALIKSADTVLYRAKGTGKNRVIGA